MFFFLFLSSLVLLVTSALVAFSTVPVNSIVFLVATFINAALMLFFFGVDFLSLIFIIVYVWATAILFLFVLMMAAIKTKIVNIFSVHSLLNFLKGVWLYFFLFFLLVSFFNIHDFFLIANLKSPNDPNQDEDDILLIIFLFSVTHIWWWLEPLYRKEIGFILIIIFHMLLFLLWYNWIKKRF